MERERDMLADVDPNGHVDCGTRRMNRIAEGFQARHRREKIGRFTRMEEIWKSVRINGNLTIIELALNIWNVPIRDGNRGHPIFYKARRNAGSDDAS